jgi:hypothetical protein
VKPTSMPPDRPLRSPRRPRRGAPPRCTAPRPPCASWAPRTGRSPSRRSPGTPGSRASGSTSNPSCAPRSNACATTGRRRPRGPPTSEPARRRCASASNRCSRRTGACATRTASCAPSSRSPTATGEKPRSSSPPRAPAPRRPRRVRFEATDPRPGLLQPLVDVVPRAPAPAEAGDLLTAKADHNRARSSWRRRPGSAAGTSSPPRLHGASPETRVAMTVSQPSPDVASSPPTRTSGSGMARR